MAKPQSLQLGSGTLIMTSHDHNGRWWVTYYKHASLFHRDAAAVRKALKLPKGTPSRELLDTWLAELETLDEQRHSKIDDNVDLSRTWGPEAHDDEHDPVRETKMVI